MNNPEKIIFFFKKNGYLINKLNDFHKEIEAEKAKNSRSPSPYSRIQEKLNKEVHITQEQNDSFNYKLQDMEKVRNLI